MRRSRSRCSALGYWSSSFAEDGAGELVVALSGVVATLLLTLAVLRPAAVFSRGSLVGPRVLVLADRSRSLDLPGDGGTRREALARAVQKIQGLGRASAPSYPGVRRGGRLSVGPSGGVRSTPAPCIPTSEPR